MSSLALQSFNTLAVVSSNSHKNVSRILGPANTKLISQFECGVSIFGKPMRMQKVTDLETARKVNIAFGAVSWGYERSNR